MGTPFAWLGASRRLILSFVLVLLVPAVAVVWLGARLIEQDRDPVATELVYEAYPGAPHIHPDGKRIVYATGGSFYQFWDAHNLGLE